MEYFLGFLVFAVLLFIFDDFGIPIFPSLIISIGISSAFVYSDYAQFAVDYSGNTLNSVTNSISSFWETNKMFFLLIFIFVALPVLMFIESFENVVSVCATALLLVCATICAYIFFDVNVFSWMYNNPITAISLPFLYCLVPLVFVPYFKWPMFVRSAMSKLMFKNDWAEYVDEHKRKAKQFEKSPETDVRKWLKGNGIHSYDLKKGSEAWYGLFEHEVPSLESFKASSFNRLQPSHHKARILNWIALWPITMLNWILKDLLVELWEFVYRAAENTLIERSNKEIDKMSKEL